MNLIIEQGNTATKVALFEEGNLRMSAKYDVLTVSTLVPVVEEYKPRQGIMSSVADTDPEMLSYLHDYLQEFLFLNEHTPLPVRVRYETPETLGRDRMAAVVGAHFLQPEQNILVIDAGTAITYELIEAPGDYLGGNISPGMTTRFKALHQFTKKLPLVAEADSIPPIGTDTASAIQAGVVNGICYEMDGYISELRLKYPDLLVFLTGGHSNYFAKRLKNTIFANINLVLIGLNRILQYNVEIKESSSDKHVGYHPVDSACTEQH